VGDDAYWDEDYDWEERMGRVADIDITSGTLYGFSFTFPAGQELAYRNEMDKINEMLSDNLFYHKTRTERLLNPDRNRDVAGTFSYPRIEKLIGEMNRQLREFRSKQGG
jgi:hypothetical protein